MRFGPQMVNLLVSSEEAAAYLAKKFGVPDMLIRDSAEREQIVQAMQEMQQMQQQAAPPPEGM
jgi:phage portal protein BeeE